jgi:hypothetical protein
LTENLPGGFEMPKSAALWHHLTVLLCAKDFLRFGFGWSSGCPVIKGFSGSSCERDSIFPTGGPHSMPLLTNQPSDRE